MSAAKKAKEHLQKPISIEPGLPNESGYLSTGITLVDLACSGQVHGGLLKGHVYRLQGRSQAGKTWVGRSILAEACRNPNFDGYDLIYDDVEYGALMDTARYFGQGLVDRLVPPARMKSTHDPVYSRTPSEFFDRLFKRLNGGSKLIWVLDSLDSLKGTNPSKMGDGKAKEYSQGLREVLDPLQETGSILILVSQVRQGKSVTVMAPPPDITSGGMAPEFYSTLEIVLKKSKAISREYRGDKYVIGHEIHARIKKNRVAGTDRYVRFNFYTKYGIDDIGANVDFLLRKKHWKRGGREGAEGESGPVIAPELDNYEGSRERLIQKVQNEGKESLVQGLVQQVWMEVEEALAVNRKPRYA